MKLSEIILTEAEQKGTYAAVRFDAETVQKLTDYIKDNEIPNGVLPAKMHCTLLYSRTHCPDYEPQGEINPPYQAKPVALEIWPSQGDDPKNCLVLKFECEDLVKRHKQLMQDHDATYDFPEYKTHVTLSYDAGDLDLDDLPDIVDAIGKLTIVSEYGEDLDLDWSKKSTKAD